MYTAFFGLNEKPFAITPDPRYLYLSARHADALAHLVYGVSEAGGFIQLTGEVGTGKTTTIRSLLARAPKDAEIALILNPRLSASEFLAALCEELGIGAPDAAYANNKDMVDVLNRYLLRAHAQGRRVVLIVDEAQNLAPDVLEQIRLLTNLETDTHKLLQIILIGQPELRTLLARNDLRQLAQRITGRYHLDPLSREESAAYVRHRLRVAGATADIFTRAALREVYRISAGVPRVINVLCDRALLAGYTQDLHLIPPALVRRSASEILGRDVTVSWLPWALGAAAAVVLGTTVWMLARRPPAVAPIRAVARGTIIAPAPASVTAAPASAPSAGPTPSVRPGTALGPLLLANRTGTDMDAAFAALFALWHAKYSPGGEEGCQQAREQGLQCLVQRGALAQLRLFNRPAILMLNDASGNAYDVVLRAVGDDVLQLQIGGRTAEVGVADLSRYWFGDFVLLWRPAVSDPHALSLGMRDPQVRQLRQELNAWRGAGETGGTGTLYDESTMHLVEQFQRSNALAIDGVAGMETQVALDAAVAASGTPLLQPRSTHPVPRGG